MRDIPAETERGDGPSASNAIVGLGIGRVPAEPRQLSWGSISAKFRYCLPCPIHQHCVRLDQRSRPCQTAWASTVRGLFDDEKPKRSGDWKMNRHERIEFAKAPEQCRLRHHQGRRETY